LYPYAGPSVQIGLFLLAVLSAASVVTALFTEYAGALQGGDSAAVPRPYVVNDLYLIASALLWAFAVWVIALMAKVVRYGRALELRTGRNVYGQVNPEEEGPFTWPKGGVPAGPALPGQGSAVLGSVLILALVAMAGMQLVELGADPPPPGAWFAIELGTPLWAAGTAAALLGIDRFVRGVEVRYAAAAPNSALASSRSASEGAAGFVP
jgi:hypothetical protein